MQNKIKIYLSFLTMFFVCAGNANAFDMNTEMSNPDEMSAAAIESYVPTGTVFEQIALMEQEKVLMQLEKERAALDLDLDRMAAERIKLHMEIDTLTGRAEQQQQALELEKQRIAAESEKLAADQLKLQAAAAMPVAAYVPPVDMSAQSEIVNTEFSKMYELIGIAGAGRQLEASIKNLNNGQVKKVSVGKYLDGYKITSISLNEGVVFDKDGMIQVLSVAGN